MKKIIFVVLTLALTTLNAQAKNTGPTATGTLINTISKYENEPGLHIISVGKLAMGLTKVIARILAETPQEKAALEVLNGIDKVVIINYEETAQAKQKTLTSKLSGLLKGAEKILEVKKDGEAVHIYGTTSDRGGAINDLILFVPEDCTMICALGSISAEKIAHLIQPASE
jgi:hypothetical protein